MGESFLGNPGETAALGNIRALHFHAYRIVGWRFIGGALASAALSGFYADPGEGHCLSMPSIADLPY
jgi:hypothetical protein